MIDSYYFTLFRLIKILIKSESTSLIKLFIYGETEINTSKNGMLVFSAQIR